MQELASLFMVLVAGGAFVVVLLVRLSVGNAKEERMARMIGESVEWHRREAELAELERQGKIPPRRW